MDAATPPAAGPDPKSLRALIAEDSEIDAELMVRELKRYGFAVDWQRVDSAVTLQEALSARRWDVVLSDYAMPGFSGAAALEIARASGLDLPFIIISGTIGEDTAVAAMRAGAHDYLLKDRLARLGPAVERTLDEAEQRRARRQAEKALSVSEVRYRRLFEAAKDGILILDANTGQIIDVNPFLISLLGYSHEDFLGKNIWEIGSFENIVATQDAFTELRTTGYSRYENLPLETHDGKKVAVEFVSNVYEVDHRPVIQCNIRDITARRQAEEALRDFEARYRTLFDRSPIGLYRTTPDGQIIDANPALVEMLGYPDRESLLRISVIDTFVDPEARQRQHALLEQAEVVTNFEMQLRRRDGTVIWCIDNLRALRDSEGRLVAYEGALRDFTANKEAQQKVRRMVDQQEAINRFTLALGDSSDLGRVYGTIYSYVGVLMDAHFFAVASYDPREQVIRADYVTADGNVLDVSSFPPIPLEEEGRGTQSRVIRTGEPLYLPNLENVLETARTRYTVDDVSNITPGPPPAEAEDVARSGLFVPMKFEGKVIGVMQVQSYRPDAYSHEDMDLLDGLANVAAIAIQNARLVEQSRRRAEELEALRNVTLDITTQLDIDRLLQRLIENAVRLLDVAAGGMYLYDPDKEVLRWAVSVGIDWIPLGTEIKRGEGLSGKVWETGQPMIVADYLAWAGHASQLEESVSAHGRAKAVVGVPVRWQGKLLGVINAAMPNDQPRTFSEQDVHLLSLLADQAAVAIQNARLYAELGAYSQTLEQAVESRTAELLAANEQLKQLDEMKDAFLSTAAHELRTPLTSIRAFSELLLLREFEEERKTRYLTMIKDQSQRLAEIINDLLDISKLEAHGDLDFRFEPVDMADLVRETLLPFTDTSPGHRFETDGLDDLPPVRADRFRLGQVLTNLLSNAVKYSPDGGTVTVRVHAGDHQLELSVRDEGIGMTPEQQAHLFERFFRVATTISGTGLGLAICKLIVERHGGSMRAESEFGKGSTFFFTVPLAENQVMRSSISQA